MGWYIFGGIIALIIQIFIASYFAEHAQKKGYNRTPYFWLCFLLGVLGYCIVAVLPDANLHYQVKELEKKINELKHSSSHSNQSTDSLWVCSNCQTKNSTNYGQCKKCGKNKS